MSSSESCPVCLETLVPPWVVAKCGHKFHIKCIGQVTKKAADPKHCPVCRDSISEIAYEFKSFPTSSFDSPMSTQTAAASTSGFGSRPMSYDPTPRTVKLLSGSIRSKVPAEESEVIMFPISLEGTFSPLNLDVLSSHSCLTTHEGKEQVLVKLQNQNKARIPTDLLFCLDLSGSMSGYPLHTLKETLLFVVDQMSIYDRICLIGFSDNAETLCPFLACTDENKPVMKMIITSLKSHGSTNIDASIKLALSTILTRKSKNLNASIFVLTDGVDDGSVVKQKLDRDENYSIPINITLNCFGYGQNADDITLTRLAQKHNGMYSFVKDQSTVSVSFALVVGAVVTMSSYNIRVNMETSKSWLKVEESFPGIYGKDKDKKLIPNSYNDETKILVFDLSYTPNTEDVSILVKCDYEQIKYSGISETVHLEKSILLTRTSLEIQKSLYYNEVQEQFYCIKYSEKLEQANIDFGERRYEIAKITLMEILEALNNSGIVGVIIKSLTNNTKALLEKIESGICHTKADVNATSSVMRTYQSRRVTNFEDMTSSPMAVSDIQSSMVHQTPLYKKT